MIHEEIVTYEVLKSVKNKTYYIPPTKGNI